MASEEVCCMIHHLHLNDHPIASIEEKSDALKGVCGGCKVDSHLSKKTVTVGASVVKKGDVAEDDDTSGEDSDSDSDSHLLDDKKQVATEEDTTQDSDSDDDADYRDYRCLGCMEPDSTWEWNQNVRSSLLMMDDEEEPDSLRMEDIDAIFAREDMTIEFINECKLASCIPPSP